jgi:hypothetical protein
VVGAHALVGCNHLGINAMAFKHAGRAEAVVDPHGCCERLHPRGNVERRDSAKQRQLEDRHEVEIAEDAGRRSAGVTIDLE